MKERNKMTAALQVAYPIIQAPMLGVSTPAMAAAVSNAGALGSLAAGGLSPELTRQLIRDTKDLTDKAFAVNLFAHDIPEAGDLEPMRALMLLLAQKNGYELAAAELDNFKLYTYRDQLDILIEEDIRLVSFTFGCLDPAGIALLKHKGIVLMGTATCVREALILAAAGVDMIVVQGIEAGGHRGSFLEDMPLPQIGLSALLPQIKDAVTLPCIAAGAINSGPTMKAAFALGADAVQIGTAFIGTRESDAIPAYKNRLSEASDTDTELTRAFSGRWARGIRNKMMQDIAASGIPIPPYPWQNSLTAVLRRGAQRANDPDYTNLWAGQAAGTQRERSADVIADLVQQYIALQDPYKPL